MSITELAERRRLEALRDLGVVPFLPDAVFDHVAEVARSHFDVPVALVTILTRDDQIFAGRQGLAMQGTPREVAFCDHTIRSDDVMVVHDALEDPASGAIRSSSASLTSASTPEHPSCSATACGSAPCASSTASRAG